MHIQISLPMEQKISNSAFNGNYRATHLQSRLQEVNIFFTWLFIYCSGGAQMLFPEAKRGHLVDAGGGTSPKITLLAAGPDDIPQ